MYPWQIAIIKKFVSKFNVTNYAIQKFIRAHRIESPEKTSKKCSSGQHEIKFGETVYIYGDKSQNSQSVFCNDLECFLSSLDNNVIQKFATDPKQPIEVH